MLTELLPASYIDRLEFEEVFGRDAPLEVDLGCGDGSFLAAVASKNPARNFLGIERLAGRVRSACRKAQDLANVRLLRIETTYAVGYLIPPESVSVFYFLFPDPWPKRRHHRRRIFTEEFLAALIAAMEPGGLLRLATDQRDYFEEMSALIGDKAELEVVPAAAWDLPETTFEKRFRKAGDPIHRLELRKTLPVM